MVLLTGLGERLDVPADLVEGAKRLDKHYLPTRYPNGFDTGAPTDYYTDEEAERAIADGGRTLAFCRDSVG
jgi:HEPN domain-containing protein